MTRIGVVYIGGLGDDLGVLNVTRQLAEHLAAQSIAATITYYNRQHYEGIFDNLFFVDSWEHLGIVSQESAVHRALSRSDVVFDLLGGRVITKDGVIAASRAAWEKGSFEEALLESLGPYQLRHDGGDLFPYLSRVSPTASRAMELKEKIDADRFLILANGTDPTMPKGQPKQIPGPVLEELAVGFWEAGFRTVQIGGVGSPRYLVEGSCDLTGKTSLVEAAWLLQEAVGVVCAEGGIAHLASHLRVKAAVLFGPTSVSLYGHPRNLNLVREACRCPLMPCHLRSAGWVLRCLSGMTFKGYPDCMDFDVPATLAAILAYFRA